jgi:hypothetical protein
MQPITTTTRTTPITATGPTVTMAETYTKMRMMEVIVRIADDTGSHSDDG